MTPFKVRSYEIGAAELIDRATNERVGYLLQDFYSRWTGYLDSDRGVPVVTERYRKDAARRLWFVMLRGHGASR